MSTFDDVDNEMTDIKNDWDDWVSSFTRIKFAGMGLVFAAVSFIPEGMYVAAIGLFIAGLMLIVHRN